MSRWTDTGHIEPRGGRIAALIPNADGELPPAGQRFVQQIVALNVAAEPETVQEATPPA